jgi:DNA polymerase I-like protein with 3'-5' exonuclease and polymerase domains
MSEKLRYLRLPSIKLYGGVIKLKYPRVIYNTTGRKILLISDSLALVEAQAGKLFSGPVGTTVANIFDKAIELEGNTPAQVLSVTTRVVRRPSQLSDAQRGENYRRITRRIARLIKQWQPDAVVFLGYQSFLDIWRSRVKFTERNYTNAQLTMLRGRLLPARIVGHDCQVILSFSPKAFASLDYKDFKNRCNLIGFVLYDMAAAIRGKNLYTVPAIDPAKRSIISTMAEFNKFFVRLLACPTPSIDTETDNLNRVYGNRLLVVLFTLDGQHTYLLPFQHLQTPFVPKELANIAERMQYYFEECRSKYIIFQNAKFDVLQFFAHFNVRYFNHRIFDLMAGEYFLDENRKFFRHEQIEGAYTLEFIGAQYGALGYETSPIAKADRGRMAEFSLQQILDYGVFDVVYPYHISQFQIAEARRRGQQYHLYLRTVCELGSDMVAVFAEMERNGVPVDLNYLASLITPDSSLSQELAKLQQKFHDLPTVQKVNVKLLAANGAPRDSYGLYGNKHNNLWLFDINKARHQQALFFQELKLQPLEYRKDGGGKTNKAFLQEYQDTIEEVKLLADYRQHEKLRNTYVVGLLKQLTEFVDNATDHRLRAFYWFIYILTCRSSATNPNLQNQPSHGKLAKIIKRLFIASIGCILVKVDYIAHEVRGWANTSKDYSIANAFAPGMLLRRKVRILRGLDIALDYDLEEWLQENDWEKLAIEQQQELIKKTSNRPELYKLLQLLIELIIKGDVHRMNYQHFFGTPAAKVTKEKRQSVKEVVFGVMYEKAAPALAAAIYFKILQPIRRKFIFRMNRAQLRKEEERYRELQDELNSELKPYWDKAQELIDKLFNKFRRGGRWIRKLQENAAKNLYVVSPFGAVRHLWGYLHSEFSMHRVMNRRSANSVIQGSASNLGYTGARQMLKLNWQLLKQKINIGYKHCNFVHDSIEAENKIAMLPLSLYYLEHSMTTQTHMRARQIFGFEMIIGLEIDIELGGSMAGMQKWDGTEASLIRIVGESIDWMQKELKYKLNKTDLLRCVKHNYRIVNKFRVKELQAMGDSYEPSESMLLTPERAGQIRWLQANELTEEKLAAD